MNKLLAITPMKQFLFLMLTHIAFIYWCFNFASLGNFLIIFFVYFCMGCLGMTLTFHRLLVHKSWQTSVYVEYIGTFLGTIGLQGSSLAWTCAHKLHHAKSDKPGDPHSPSILGFFRAHFLSMFSPIKITQSPVIHSKFHIFMHRYYFHINLIYGSFLFLLGGIFGILHFWLVPAFILWHAGNIINTFGHSEWFGYKTFKISDHSVNNPIMGLLMWGEGWHNNHHRFPTSCNFGKKWYEVDIGYICILLINKCNKWKIS